MSITDIAFVKGKVVVAGLSNEEFASKLRVLDYPFKNSNAGASVEIFHGAHGRFETRSPIRTFIPYEIDGRPHIVAVPAMRNLLALRCPGSGECAQTTVSPNGPAVRRR